MSEHDAPGGGGAPAGGQAMTSFTIPTIATPRLTLRAARLEEFDTFAGARTDSVCDPVGLLAPTGPAALLLPIPHPKTPAQGP